MSDKTPNNSADRLALPRDAFRDRRVVLEKAADREAKPVIVTPDYKDPVGAESGPGTVEPERVKAPTAKARAASPQHPFNAYGERSSSRPYALRLPEPIDLVLRQLAAEQRTHPLRVIDRILHDHLKRIGRLPPPQGA